ncbi:MAG TPA: S4 domain-containing protein, partial [Longimicrobiaceae bacterium]|nr:S4 domain-containing protein [Longimicrobiaceae bacterium]
MEALRIDVLLHRLCLTRSRSEAKHACQAGAVAVRGDPVAASHNVDVGDLITIRFAKHIMELELLELPGKSTSRKAARDMYRIVREEPLIAG